MNKNFTIFTLPKPFTNPHINTIQHNAIKSWIALGCEIILMGNDPGIKEAAEKYNLKHIPNIKCNEFNTPLLSDAFQKARETAENDILVYINADIITCSDFSEFLNYKLQDEFLIIGGRYDLDIVDFINFENKNWEKDLWLKVEKEGKKHPLQGSDYFIFRKKSLTDIPEFAVGRVGWDIWMINEAQKRNLQTIDATSALTIIHQNHDYSHQVNKDKSKTDTEAVRHLDLMKRDGYLYPDEVKWIMKRNKVLKRWWPGKVKIKKKLRSKLFRIKKWLLK